MGRRSGDRGNGSDYADGTVWEAIPNGIAIWRALRPRARRIPPGWSRRDWLAEVQSVCLLCAVEARPQFNPARGVPEEKFLYLKLRNAARDHYRQESRFRKRHGELTQDVKPVNRWETVPLEDAVALWQEVHALPREVDRRLVVWLYIDGKSEAWVAHELGVSQSTISKRKQLLLNLLRERIKRNGKNS